MNTRLITVDELSSLIPGALAFVEELGPPYKLDIPIFLAMWEEAYRTKTGVIFVIEENGVKASAMGLHLFYDPLLSTITATEGFWFVDPSFRNSLAGVMLFRDVEKWVKESPATWFTMACPETLPSSPTLKRFFQKQDYTAVETSFRKAI